MYHAFFVSILLLSHTTSFSADSQLSLTAAGTINAAPSWTNSSGNTVTSVDFDYSSFVPGVADSNVDSSLFALLLNDPSNSGNVRFALVTTPTGCTIGSQSVTNSHIRLVRNTIEIPNNAMMPLLEGNQYNIFLRFIDDGNYGSSTGSVSCSTAGSLTYSY